MVAGYQSYTCGMPAWPPMHPPAIRPVALVTGAAKRLGRVTALRLAADGWRVAVHHRQSAVEAQGLVAQIQGHGGQAQAFALDLDQLPADDGLDAWWQGLEAALGPVGLLVNNAARFEFDLATTATQESLECHLRSNLVAPIRLIQALHRSCMRSPPETPNPMAVVINLLDQKLVNPNPDFFGYTISKAGLDHATRLMAQALAPKLRVLSVSPGISLPSAGQTDEAFARAHQETPLGGSSTADEVADAVAWLARARAVTGANLLVDGGQHLRPSERDVLFTTQ